jgi:chromosome segregation ATPase
VPIKQSDFDALYKQLTNLIPATLDLLRQVGKYIPISLDALERHNRAFEELSSVRLEIEVLKEIQRENTFEIARWANQLSKDMRRLEEYTILSNMGKSDSPKAKEITQEVGGEHLEYKLNEKLADKQKELASWARNLSHVQQEIAKMGYANIENSNKEQEYQSKIDKLTKEIERLREALRTIEN